MVLLAFLLKPSVAVAIVTIILFILYQKDMDASPFTLEDVTQAMHNKTIVITGANAGLGYSTVFLLAKASGTHSADGTAIVMACRSIRRCNKARHTILQTTQTKVQIHTLELDLSSIESIKSFVHTLQRTLDTSKSSSQQHTMTNTSSSSSSSSSPPHPYTPPIHILINNAGIMGTPYTLAKETSIEMQMQVNHLGHFALTSLLVPNFIAVTNIYTPSSMDTRMILDKYDTNHDSNAKSGMVRIVSVSSLLGSYGPAFQFKDINFIDRRKRRWIFNHHTPIPILQSFMDMIQSFLQYAASKRANLLFTHGLHQRVYVPSKGTIQAVVVHPGYSRTNLVVSGWYYIPLWFRTFFSRNRIGSMSSENGAMCILRAALDTKTVSSDDYIGPYYMTFGKPTIVGASLKSKHHLFWPISNNGTEVDELWTWSESILGWKFPSIPHN